MKWLSSPGLANAKGNVVSWIFQCAIGDWLGVCFSQGRVTGALPRSLWAAHFSTRLPACPRSSRTSGQACVASDVQYLARPTISLSSSEPLCGDSEVKRQVIGQWNWVLCGTKLKKKFLPYELGSEKKTQQTEPCRHSKWSQRELCEQPGSAWTWRPLARKLGDSTSGTMLLSSSSLFIKTQSINSPTCLPGIQRMPQIHIWEVSTKFYIRFSQYILIFIGKKSV